MKKKIAILGSTGSIGKNLINILKNDKKNFEIVLLSTNKNYKELLKQAKIFNVKNLIINNKNILNKVKLKINSKKINIFNNFSKIDDIFDKLDGFLGISPCASSEYDEYSFHHKLSKQLGQPIESLTWNVSNSELFEKFEISAGSLSINDKSIVVNDTSFNVNYTINIT